MVRVSTPGQAEDEKTGLDRQRRDIRFTCNHFNLGVVKEFPLVVTGAQVQRTPEVRELQRWIQRTDIQGLVIPSIDRLSRDDRFSSVGDLMRPFEEIMGGKSTKRIWTRKDELDVTVRSDRQKIWDALNYAAVEREMIAFRTGEGRDILRESETAKIDKLPFYVKFTPVDAKVNEGKFSWIPEYRAMMAEAARRVVKGQTINSVFRDIFIDPDSGKPRLNPSNLNKKTREPKPLLSSLDALSSALRSPWLLGHKTKLYTFENKVWLEDKRRYTTGTKVLLPEDRRIDVAIPNLVKDPVISQELYDRVQEVLDRNIETWTQGRSHVNEFLGVGLANCGKCGSKLYLHPGDPTHKPAYYCASKQRHKGPCPMPRTQAWKIDNEIVLQAHMAMNDEAYTQARIKESRNEETIRERRLTLERLKKERAGLEREKKNMLDAIKTSKGVITFKTFDADFVMNERRTAEVDAKIRALEDSLSAEHTDEEINALAANVRAQFTGFMQMDRPVQKQLLLKYVSRIDVTVDDSADVKVFFHVHAGEPEPQHQAMNYPEPEPSTPLEGGKGKPKPIRIVDGGEYGRVRTLEETVDDLKNQVVKGVTGRTKSPSNS
jgi:hypothetical protein